MIEWTDERVETLKRLWEGGVSAAQIATALGGISRNAVIGKVHRLGLSGRRTVVKRAKRTVSAVAGVKAPSPSAWDNMSEREKVAYVRKGTEAGLAASMIAAELGVTTWQVSSVRARARISAPRSDVVGEVVELELPATRTIMTIAHGECRAVIGDPSAEEPAMCGRPAVEGAHPYCEHHKRWFVSVVRTERSNANAAVTYVEHARVARVAQRSW